MAKKKEKRRMYYCKICGKTFETYRGFRVHQSLTGHKLPVDRVHVKEIEVSFMSDDGTRAVTLKVEPKQGSIVSCIRYAHDILKKAIEEVDEDE